jgi:hypothetical protein
LIYLLQISNIIEYAVPVSDKIGVCAFDEMSCGVGDKIFAIVPFAVIISM